ncbi:MAG: 16S rRNA (cytosine(1402)-N(4))-methyltransferase RsmH [Candidatus Daviesbacteria bacterium]|nr:16S rRNA (cytosine(1402)-N(4))-methyltransferase RsmH [Candidatus Daviesbacteria bacterium]
MGSYHIPVMPEEAITYLKVQKGAWYIDCNLGGGGHTERILNAGGKVLGIDCDLDAIKQVSQKYGLTLNLINDRFQAISESLIICQANFSQIKEISSSLLPQSPAGILFDLGLSSYQLETDTRGFSFNKNAPLDMRMDRTQTLTAADLVNGLYVNELAELFWKYGEEQFAKPIARRIVEYRSHEKIDTTEKLAQIILSVKKIDKSKKIHPATKVFQALRIAVNDELTNLEETLPQALEILQPFGRLVIISFHSLEDRIVKNFFKAEEENNTVRVITQKPLEPEEKEIQDNPRSRSAKLRAAEKI